MGRADPGTVISELLSVQKLVALAGSVNRRLRSVFNARRKSRSLCRGDALYFRLRRGPWNFGALAASPNATSPPMQDQPRRFPHDHRSRHNGQALAYCYYEQEPSRRAAARLLTRDEARRILPRTVFRPNVLIASAPR
jgi:hypothetical protein